MALVCNNLRHFDYVVYCFLRHFFPAGRQSCTVDLSLGINFSVAKNYTIKIINKNALDQINCKKETCTYI